MNKAFKFNRTCQKRMSEFAIVEIIIKQYMKSIKTVFKYKFNVS